jgi:hypothetical protein
VRGRRDHLCALYDHVFRKRTECGEVPAPENTETIPRSVSRSTHDGRRNFKTVFRERKCAYLDSGLFGLLSQPRMGVRNTRWARSGSSGSAAAITVPELNK